MKRWLIEAAVVLVVFLGVRAYQTRDLVEGELPVSRALTITGKTVAFTATDRSTLVYFWATWCGVCRAQQGTIRDLAQRARVVSIASQSEGAAAVARYMREHDLRFDTVDDTSGALAQRFGVRAFPTSFIVDKQGHIRSREVGYTTTPGLLARLWLAER